MSPSAKEKEYVPKHKKVGPYRVRQVLGRGGMAVVFGGLHEQLQREVAIKELLPIARHDPEGMSRFRREALALAAFRHQGIVTLYDLIEKNDSLFMILELVDGPTLADLMKEGPLPPEVAAVIGAKVASALEHAHFNRIIHRDIKPSNVMFTKSGEVKLMDFGIAKDIGLEALTRQGMAIGTPSYMSPEQVAGKKIDHRTDLYSLGAMLYEALAGQKAFTGKSAGEVFAKIRDGRCVPLGKAAPRVPRALRRIVERAMKVKGDQRYPDAASLRRDLEAWCASQLTVSDSALLIAFLRYRKKLTQTEALVHLSSGELTAAQTFVRTQHPHPWRWVGFALCAAAAGGGWYAWAHGLLRGLWPLR
jgi:serine/threonine-protein kinase